MEFRAQDIAQLVLGYLKDEKCQSAFCKFLNNSVHLKDHAVSHSKGKYFVTRVAGLSLVDYLTEYAIIYTIVQERLEASEYYKENRSRTTLIKQLLYLLDNEGIQSRTSTPIHDYINRNSHQERAFSKPNFVNTQVQHVPEISSNNSLERLSVGINTTPPHSLPGNSSVDSSFLNNSKRKSVTSLPKIDKSTSTDDDFEAREKSQEKLEIFTQTLLENAEFIEKLTENINKEVSSKSASELDSSIIQSIVQQTEADPVFVQLFEELIGTAIEEEDDENPVNSSTEKPAEECPTKLNSDLPSVPPSTPKRASDVISPSNCLKQRLRSSRKSRPTSSPFTDPPSIEEQNNEAVELIIAASLSTDQQPLESEESVSSNTPSVPMEVVLPAGSYDNIVQTAFANSGAQNQIYTNSSGLLMLQPNATVPCSNVGPPRNLQIDPPKPCYIIGNQPFVNVNVPQTPFKMLTEQDILTMPTIFVCDNNQQPASTQTVIMSQPVTTNSMGQNRLINIAPKGTPEKAQTLSEYITLYQCNDSFTSVVSPPKPRATKLRQIASTTTKAKKTANKNQRHTPHLEKLEVLPPPVVPPLHNFSNLCSSITQGAPTAENAVSMMETEFFAEKPEESQHITPKTKVAEKKEGLSRSTPRSGSHVRQLDFSTPDKWFPMLRRAATSPKMEKPLEHKETTKTIKTNTSKNIRTTLFKSPDAEIPVPDALNGVTEKQNVQNSGGELGLDPMKTSKTPELSTMQTEKSNTAKASAAASWDADLRALAGSSMPDKPVVQKQKRKRSEEAQKPASSAKKFKEGVGNLNKTEDDALKIEMALRGIAAEVESADPVTETLNESIKDSAKPPNKRRDRLTTKKVISAKKIGRSNAERPAPEKAADIPNPSVDKLCAISVKVDEEVPDDVEDFKTCVSEQSSLEKPYAVINRNMKPRIKKKCNMENTVKKTPVPEEIVLTNVTRIKSCEIIDDGQNTLILSPSKLNANKRTLVEAENRHPVVEQSANTQIISSDGDNKDTTDGKNTTPELVKTSVNNPPLTAKRMPVLETPVKFDSIAFPKTPGIASSPVIDTPFTKAVIDQLTGVDITNIPTPKFPITPNFPFTPVSPFSNRGTDYSTSSSYYQPSDTEQNKSLEQLIEECRRLENQPASLKNSKDEDQAGLELKKSQEKPGGNHQGTAGSVSSNKNVQKQNPETAKKLEVSQTESLQHIKSISDKEKAFNLSMIGKKNLHLVKMLTDDAEAEKDSSSDSSSTDCSSSSTSSDESDSSNCDFANVDATVSKERNSSPYSLRPRKSLAKNVSNSSISKEKDVPVQQPKLAPTKNESSAELPPEKPQAKPSTFQDGLLKEMEQIRQRTIAKFKDASSSSKKPDKKKKPPPKKKSIKVSAKLSVVEKTQQSQTVNPSEPEKAVKDSTSDNPAVTNKTTNISINSSVKKQRRKSDSPKKSGSPKKSDSVKNLKQLEHPAQKPENLVAPKLNYKNESNVKLDSYEKHKQEEPPIRNAGTSGTSVARKRNQSETKPELSKQSHPTQVKEQSKASNLSLKNAKSEATPGSSKMTKQSEDCEKKETHPEPSKLTLKSNQIPAKLNSPKKLKTQKEGKPQITYISLKDAKAMVDDEDDIILHLSSDEENLEPFEMVETELLECSTSSTPIGDEQRTNPVSNTANVNKKPSTEQKTEEMVDQEAESLVKGLKQWGIHLVPNKPTKKCAAPTETMEGVFSGTKVVDHRRPGSPLEETPKNTTESLAIPKEKHQEKLNQSVEEGELVSDAEDDPKQEIKLEQKKLINIKKSDSGKISDSRRNSDSTRENKRSQAQHGRSKETARSRSYSEGLSKSSTTSASRRALPTKSKISERRNVPASKSSKTSEKTVEAKTVTVDNKSGDKPGPVVEKEVGASELDYQMEFNLRTYEQETFSVKHDYSKKSTRKMTDYNFDILTKKFSANVYIAEIDSEVEKILLFSPYEVLLDIPSRTPTSVAQKRSSVTNKPSTQMQIKKKQNPLKILYNQLVKPASDPPRRSSPLEDLYGTESSARETRKIGGESHTSKRDVTTVKSDKNEKPEKSNRSIQKSVAKDSSLKEQSQSKSVERSKKESASDQQKVKHHATTSESSKNTSPRNSKVLSTSSKKEESTKTSTGDLEVVDGVIMLNSNVDDSQQRETEDELMNYALVGSVLGEDGEESLTMENKKRKTTEGAEGEQKQEKKQKAEVCQELLRNIDVDSFLKKLHGET